MKTEIIYYKTILWIWAWLSPLIREYTCWNPHFNNISICSMVYIGAYHFSYTGQKVDSEYISESKITTPYVVCFRCVALPQRSFALGIQWIIARCLGELCAGLSWFNKLSNRYTTRSCWASCLFSGMLKEVLAQLMHDGKFTPMHDLLMLKIIVGIVCSKSIE